MSIDSTPVTTPPTSSHGNVPFAFERGKTPLAIDTTVEVQLGDDDLRSAFEDDDDAQGADGWWRIGKGSRRGSREKERKDSIAVSPTQIVLEDEVVEEKAKEKKKSSGWKWGCFGK